jgi:hypothetical protein
MIYIWVKEKRMFKELDPLLHSQLRLSIISILMSVDEANFNFIKDETKATSGNISIQKIHSSEIIFLLFLYSIILLPIQYAGICKTGSC